MRIAAEDVGEWGLALMALVIGRERLFKNYYFRHSALVTCDNISLFIAIISPDELCTTVELHDCIFDRN